MEVVGAGAQPPAPEHGGDSVTDIRNFVALENPQDLVSDEFIARIREQWSVEDLREVGCDDIWG